jgi:putative transferase (TIGR04331 family)
VSGLVFFMSYIDFKVLEGSSVPKRRIECYQFYLTRLVSHLNHVHKTCHDTKYWEIIIGPWLMYFIWYIDYYFFSSYRPPESSEVNCVRCNVPYDMTSLVHMINKTEYAGQLGSMVDDILEDDKITFECFKVPPLNETTWKIWAKKVYNHIYRLTSGYSKVILASPYFSIKSQFKVALLSRLRIVPFFCSDTGKNNLLLNFELRKWLKTRATFDNNLDAVLHKLVLQQMPYVYLEGYRYLLKQLPPLKSRQKVVCSSVGWFSNELLQCFFAIHQEQGGRLVGLQHGGGPYGIGVNPNSLGEKEAADNYLTWGWKLSEKDTPFVSMALSLKKKDFDSRCHGVSRKNILYATTTFHQHEPDGRGMPSGADMSIYIKQQHQFVKSLSSNVRDQLIIRFYPEESHVHPRQRQREAFESLMLKLRFDDNKSLVDSLLKSRLVVLDNIQTVFFEVIAYGIPVMIFHDESMWEFNREFESMCEEMKKLNMLHTSPESIAQFLSEIIGDIEVWWNSSELQRLRERLRSNYARTSHDPERILIDQLNRIVGAKN